MKRATPKFQLALKRASLNQARIDYCNAKAELSKANKGSSKLTKGQVFSWLNKAKKALMDAIIETTIALYEFKQLKQKAVA